MKRIGREFGVLGITIAIVFSGFMAPGIASAVTWYFDLPSTAASLQNPPYPVVATLELTEIEGGVQFVLTPKWFDSPTGFSEQSFINQIDFVYKGPALTGTDWFIVAAGGPEVKDFKYETNQNNMDSGYKTNDQHILVDFGDKKDTRFDNSYTTAGWTVIGASLADFTDTSATSDSKPSTTQGVISVSGYLLDGMEPTRSNWVTGPAPELEVFTEGAGIPIPEPTTLILFGSALIGLVGLGRKFSK